MLGYHLTSVEIFYTCLIVNVTDKKEKTSELLRNQVVSIKILH